jgi:hypothetical protein
MVPTFYYQLDHDPDCTCGVRQYPWHDIIEYSIEKRGDPLTPLYTYFDRETYNLCLKNTTNGKAPGLDRTPNSILKNMPPQFRGKLLRELGVGSGERGILILILKNSDNHGKGDLLLWIMKLWIF